MFLENARDRTPRNDIYTNKCMYARTKFRPNNIVWDTSRRDMFVHDDTTASVHVVTRVYRAILEGIKHRCTRAWASELNTALVDRQCIGS